MQSILLSVLSSFLVPFFGQPPADFTLSMTTVPVEWKCDAVTWPTQPYMDGSILKAKVSARCTFKGLTGGGFAELEPYLVKRIQTQSEKVFSGPTSETYKNLPSTFIDSVVKIGNDSDYAMVRQNSHVASDLKTIVVFDAISTSIEGQGNAAYMKKVDAFTDVTPLNPKANTYNTGVVSYFEIEKPWFVPAGVFVSKVKEEIEKRAQDLEKSLLEDIAQHI